MSERDRLTQSGRLDRNDLADQPDCSNQQARPRATDDRRGQVNPVDKPVPRSPEPEPDAVREAEEKLHRVKPY